MGKDFGSNVLRQFSELRLELIADFDIPSHQLIMAHNTYVLKIISQCGEAEEHTATLEFIEITPEGALATADHVAPAVRLEARFKLAIKQIEPFNFLYERCKDKKMPRTAMPI